MSIAGIPRSPLTASQITNAILSDSVKFKGANVSKFNTIGWGYTESNDVLKNDASEYTHTTVTYAKQTEHTVPANVSGDFRVKTELKAESGCTAYARIYKNGIALSDVESTVSTTYINISWDLTGFAAGDTIELWTKSSIGGSYVKVQNFSIGGVSVYDPIKTEPTW